MLHQFAGATERQFFLDVRMVGLNRFHADVRFLRSILASGFLPPSACHPRNHNQRHRIQENRNRDRSRMAVGQIFEQQFGADKRQNAISGPNEFDALPARPTEGDGKRQAAGNERANDSDMRCSRSHADRRQPDQTRNKECGDRADGQDRRQQPKQPLVPTLSFKSSANGVAQKRANGHHPNHPAWGGGECPGQRSTGILQ